MPTTVTQTHIHTITVLHSHSLFAAVTLTTATSSTSAITAVPPAFKASTVLITIEGVTATVPLATTFTVTATLPLATTSFTVTDIAPIVTAFESSTTGTSHKGVIVGSIVGIFVIVICLCMYRFYVYRKRKNSQSFINVAKNVADSHPGIPVTATSVPHPAQPNELAVHPLPLPEAILRPLRVVHSHDPQSDMLLLARRRTDSHSDPFSNTNFASEYAKRATSNLEELEGDLSLRSTFESMLSEPNAIVPVMNPQTLRYSEALSTLSGPSTALPLYASLALSPMPPSFCTLDPLFKHSD